jgi:hypothetical protein
VTAAGLEQTSDADDGVVGEAADDLAAFLATLAAMLRETISRFEQTAAKVTDLIVTLPGQTDRELVVALQDFDRLNQEFAAISDALARTGASMTGSWMHEDGHDHPKHKVIHGISIAELRDRVINHLNSAPPEASVDSMLEEPLPSEDDGMLAEF